MVHWSWLIISAFVGAGIALFTLGILIVSDRGVDYDRRDWDEDDRNEYR